MSSDSSFVLPDRLSLFDWRLSRSELTVTALLAVSAQIALSVGVAVYWLLNDTHPYLLNISKPLDIVAPFLWIGVAVAILQRKPSLASGLAFAGAALSLSDAVRQVDARGIETLVNDGTAFTLLALLAAAGVFALRNESDFLQDKSLLRWMSIATLVMAVVWVVAGVGVALSDDISSISYFTTTHGFSFSQATEWIWLGGQIAAIALLIRRPELAVAVGALLFTRMFGSFAWLTISARVDLVIQSCLYVAVAAAAFVLLGRLANAGLANAGLANDVGASRSISSEHNDEFPSGELLPDAR